MAIQTQPAFSGFIASDPQLSTTESGDARLSAQKFVWFHKHGTPCRDSLLLWSYACEPNVQSKRLALGKRLTEGLEH